MQHHAIRAHCRNRAAAKGLAFVGAILALSATSTAQLHPAVEQNHAGNALKVDQFELNTVNAGSLHDGHVLAFELGDEIFEAKFNAIDGGGANVGRGDRFTRVPRADLTGPRQWANHVPTRATGPNGQNCIQCHNTPAPDGAGEASSNVHRDPQHGGLRRMITRNTPILFGSGPLQRLAEEMTEELHGIVDATGKAAQSSGMIVTEALTTKGVDFGFVRARRGPDGPRFRFRLMGIDRDLVVKPFQWKGNFASLRDFNRDASHQELGMQSTEIVGHGVDGDFDGVADEMTVGDQTALAVYLAGQPRPVTGRELADAGVIPPLSVEELGAIDSGSALFEEVGCAVCHIPALELDDPVFSEPSQNEFYRDSTFPSGDDPAAEGLSPATAIMFNMATDTLDNQLPDGLGGVIDLGNLESNGAGGAIVRLFGDLKRHDLGSPVAEQIDETGHGASVFLTKELWGVGDTAPYLHNGSATTLTEAILAHGGEGAASRAAFFSLTPGEQADVIAFLNDLRIFLDGETAGIGEEE